MSHGPKVPSTLKLLEGIEVSLLFSLELLNFLLLYQESQGHSTQRGLLQASEASHCIHGMCLLNSGAVTMAPTAPPSPLSWLSSVLGAQEKQPSREGAQEADSSWPQLP